MCVGQKEGNERKSFDSVGKAKIFHYLDELLYLHMYDR